MSLDIEYDEFRSKESYRIELTRLAREIEALDKAQSTLRLSMSSSTSKKKDKDEISKLWEKSFDLKKRQSELRMYLHPRDYLNNALATYEMQLDSFRKHAWCGKPEKIKYSNAIESVERYHDSEDSFVTDAHDHIEGMKCRHKRGRVVLKCDCVEREEGIIHTFALSDRAKRLRSMGRLHVDTYFIDVYVHKFCVGTAEGRDRFLCCSFDFLNGKCTIESEFERCRQKPKSKPKLESPREIEE